MYPIRGFDISGLMGHGRAYIHIATSLTALATIVHEWLHAGWSMLCIFTVDPGSSRVVAFDKSFDYAVRWQAARGQWTSTDNHLLIKGRCAAFTECRCAFDSMARRWHATGFLRHPIQGRQRHGNRCRNDKKPDEVWVQQANSVGAATAALDQDRCAASIMLNPERKAEVPQGRFSIFRMGPAWRGVCVSQTQP
jgi:hypothetical protein